MHIQTIDFLLALTDCDQQVVSGLQPTAACRHASSPLHSCWVTYWLSCDSAEVISQYKL